MQNDVKVFMEACGQFVQPFHAPQYPNQLELFPDEFENTQVDLYLKLIHEEFQELVEGHENKNIVEVADACGDLIWVILGMCNSLGIDISPVWQEIASSNMSKTINGKVIKREDGKIMKPDGYFPPNIHRALGQSTNE